MMLEIEKYGKLRKREDDPQDQISQNKSARWAQKKICIIWKSESK